MPAQSPIDKREQAAIDLYANLMEEAKVRFYLINMAIGGKTGLPERGVREFCYLQIRMLCEVIALACLAANGTVKETGGKDPQKGAYADKIIKRLGGLNQEFYPRPAVEKGSGGATRLVPATESFLAPDELVKLYDLCGDHLHRGSLKRLLDPKELFPAKYEDIVGWTNKIVKLLDRHYITLGDKKTVILCLLGENYPKGRVRIVLASPPGRARSVS
jgi:hypothetical protein